MLSFLSLVPTLPKYSGPHRVGSTEYEIPITEIDTKFSPTELDISTIKFRLYYPTSAITSKSTTTWVPPPQRQWTEAFTDFLGLSSKLSRVLHPLLSVLSYVTIPALANAKLLRPSAGKRLSLAIFSHGLAGNCNTYSTLCGSLASCGVLCAAIEHRDGSAPMSTVRAADGTVASTVGYKKYSHAPSTEVFDARNAQLRIRSWELDLLYTALTRLDAGEGLSNFTTQPNTSDPTLEHTLDLAPGHVSWIGHSFGAATISQFIKSIYYRNSLPSLRGTPQEDDPGWRPLYTESSSNNLVSQITPTSPVALLDVWTMPLKAHSTQWQWQKPMPCYDQPQPPSVPTTIALISTEFHKWTDLKDRTRALLSSNPARTWDQIQKHKQSPSPAPERPLSSPTVATPPNKASHSDAAEELTLPPSTIPTSSHLSPIFQTPTDPTSDISRTPSPSTTAQTPTSAASTSTSLSSTTAADDSSYLPARLYHIASTAHLSQSDFGVLFPTLTRYLMNAIDPVGTMKLNVRAITAVMRGAGLRVEGVVENRGRGGWLGWASGAHDGGEGEEMKQDGILMGDVWTDGKRENRWEEVKLQEGMTW